jgi:hypothetical protein
MSDSTLSFASSSSFRNTLMGRNLPPYNVTGVYTPPVGDVNYPTVLSDSNVIDSPDDLITNSPFSSQAYVLNEFGPEGGYNQNINYNGPALPVLSNQGEYSPNETQMDILNEQFIDAAFTQNPFGPTGGFNSMVEITDLNFEQYFYQPYWDPPIFVPSSYSPYSILLSPNASGNNGLLSQDSFIARIGAMELRKAFQERVNVEIYQNTVGVVNLQSLSDPFNAALIAAGREPLIFQNWRITIPEFPLFAIGDFVARLGGVNFPLSPIPGDYFEDNTNNGQTQQTSNALNVINQLTGGFLGPILNRRRNPSEIFIANTGNATRSALFRNIDYNRYQPDYNRGLGGVAGIFQGIVNLAIDLINPTNGTLVGGYYVGSRQSEPATITSPPNQIPVNVFGQQVQTPVYGPSELAQLYEGNIDKLNFGLAGKSYTDSGSISGDFVWTSPKYKPSAGFKATVGGGTGSQDSEFNSIASTYIQGESTNITFKETSILDQTQRLVQSADNVTGINRLKHVGTAINQVSKVFNDGYKEITKGSRVVSYVNETTGEQAGTEYCRIFTKDTPYYTYADLQKRDGIVNSGRRFGYSVLENTYNLNITPVKTSDNSFTPKKYMFSIENLAWRTSSKEGFRYDDLPNCEKGPNGGRVMWFPPYNLKFSDTSNPNFNPTSFLGRPEPIYTYKDTTRTGTLSWDIIVDHPSILNLIVNKQLKNTDNSRVNSIIDSFFAGCTKYDIYTLAQKFNQIPLKDLKFYEEILNQSNDFDTIEKVVNQTTSINTPTETKPKTEDTSINDYKSKYSGGLGFYFDNDVPCPKDKRTTTSDSNFGQDYQTYIGRKTTYITTAESTFSEGNTNRNVGQFFDTVIIDNYSKIATNENGNFITDTINLIKDKKATVTITMEGSASAPATNDYNKTLTKRRIDSIIKFLKTNPVLENFINEKKLIIKESPQGEETKVVFPVSSRGEFGGTINCTDDIKDKNNKVTQNSQIYSVSAMACRRVIISNIEVVSPPEDNVVENNEGPQEQINQKIVEKKVPKPPTITLQEKFKEGLGKRILRNLLTECDYFEVIKEENPMIFNSIKDKIKYFNPAFHSMTPEGLNSRLTFLNQCVRPGETIPTIDSDGNVTSPDATNTSFGTPPILILRVGDFYNSKIVPTGLSFSYEPLVYDLNPEGIGVQPMIAKVTLSFNFIGGQGLKEPVDELQNALSFNYYANTEIYDERATPTDDSFKIIDQQIINSLTNNQSPVSTLNQNGGIPNDAGNTIGIIQTTNNIEGGITGLTSYEKIMDLTIDTTKSYYDLILNKTKSLIEEYNFGVWELVSKERNYIKGEFKSNNNEISIYGSPTNIEPKIDKAFSLLINDINNDTNYIMNNLLRFNFKDSEYQQVKNNFIEYINNYKSVFSEGIFNNVNEIKSQETISIQNFRKINLIVQNTDGKIPDNGIPEVYNINPTNETDQSSTNPIPLNSMEELKNDFNRLGLNVQRFYDEVLVGQRLIFENGSNYDVDTGDFSNKSAEILTDVDKRMFLILSKVFTDNNKIEEFKTKLVPIELVDSNPKLNRKVRNIVNDFAKKSEKELKEEIKFIDKIIKDKITTTIVKELPYNKGKKRVFSYTTIPQDENKKVLINDLYKGSQGDTWNDKINL